MDLTFRRDPPAFFVPAAEGDDEAEEVYGQFAAMCHRSVPPRSERVYGIKWVHDGQEWIAEVGETLRGVERQDEQQRGRRARPPRRLTDPATVLAIFPGNPYFVVTTGAFGVVSA